MYNEIAAYVVSIAGTLLGVIGAFKALSLFRKAREEQAAWVDRSARSDYESDLSRKFREGLIEEWRAQGLTPEQIEERLKPTKGSTFPRFNALPAGGPNTQARIMLACFVVGFVFALSVGVVWCLTKIGGPIAADVQTMVKRLGGSVWIAATGLFGAFFCSRIPWFWSGLRLLPKIVPSS